jgi:hypothetical protein
VAIDTQVVDSEKPSSIKVTRASWRNGWNKKYKVSLKEVPLAISGTM